MTKFMLKYGDENKEVLEAQKLLQIVGSKVRVNGKFSIGMISAVRAFQKKNGLEITGKIDSKTMTKLRSFAKTKKAAKSVKVKK